MADKRKSNPSTNKNISINGDVKDSIVSIGDNNIFQKIVNYIFPSEKETTEQRNRRILLGHVENAWIKGVLDASLHGAALLDLGIKQDPEAVTKYPWAIKKESTDETLPAGTSMLEIFDSIGMGRSLLILGAPGSGKTTMLLELARQLIQHARENVTYPIPMVFNLASWTEKLTLADWLALELNNLYSVPRKTAPDWVKGNKLLLLLDGLDEVRQESRANCVEAINAFRKEHGLTSLAVCSRSQDYADLNAKLSFEGAIEVQPLTQKQITEFFNRFGDEMAGIKQVLKKDSALREMAETPLFLSIMIMAYKDKRDVEILISGDERGRRKHLFDTYIERMFERPRSKNGAFLKRDILHWLSWLASKMIEHNQIPYLLEDMSPTWLSHKKQWMIRKSNVILFVSLSILMTSALVGGFVGLLSNEFSRGLNGGLSFGVFCTLGVILLGFGRENWNDFQIISIVSLGLNIAPKTIANKLTFGLIIGLIFGLILSPVFGIALGLIFVLLGAPEVLPVSQTTNPGQRIALSIKNSFLTSILIGPGLGLILILIETQSQNRILIDLPRTINTVEFLVMALAFITSFGLLFALNFGLKYGGYSVIKHYTLRLLLYYNNLLPWKLVPFLNHCANLVFLRRVGSGYIFVHRLLMEHFSEISKEVDDATQIPVASQQFRWNLGTIANAIILSLIFLSTILVIFSPYDVNQVGIKDRFLEPSLMHPMGTDAFGRDQMTRTLYGGQVSLTAGFLAVFISLSMGITLGSLAGYFRGWLDNALMRITDAMLTLPTFTVLILLSAIFRTTRDNQVTHIALMIGVLSWMTVFRLVRAIFVAKLKIDVDYMLDKSNKRVAVRNVLSSGIKIIMIEAVFGISHAIIEEAGLSFLGLGIQPPTPSWGELLAGTQRFAPQYFWMRLFPALMIFLTIISVNYIGEYLLDIARPPKTANSQVVYKE